MEIVTVNKGIDFPQRSHRHHHIIVSRFYLSCLFLFFTIVSFGQRKPDPPPSPGTGGTVGGFEVDAHFASGGIPAFWAHNLSSYSAPYTPSYTPNITTYGKDWSGTNGVLLKNNAGVFVPGKSTDLRSVWQVDGNWGNKSPAAETVSFAGSSNKNSDLIGAGQSPYLLQLGGTGPQKNDITNTYLHSREDGNDTWLFFGAETRATNGSSYLDFEYNQKGVQVSGLNLIGNGTIGGRTPGDFILVVNYVDGGSVPLIGVRIWQASGAWSEELPASNLNAYITINTTDVPAVAPNAGYKDDGSTTSTTKALQMVEGGINISDLEEFAALNLCSPEATVTVKTRSSASFTAELKDLDVIPFSIIPGPEGDNVPFSLCSDAIGGSTATFDLTTKASAVTGGASGVNVVGWFENYNSTTGVFSNAIGTPGAYSSGNKTVYAKLANANDCIGKGEVSLTVNSSPAGTNTSQTMCSDAIGGSTATFDLTLKNSTVTGGVSGVSVVGWFENYNSTTGVFSNAIGTPGAYSSGNKTVYAKISNASNCMGKADNVLTIRTSPPKPAVVYNAPACDAATFSVTVGAAGNPVIEGAKYTIVDKNGAAISGVSPASPHTATAADATNGFSFSNIPAGSGFKVSVESAAGCFSDPEPCGTATLVTNRINESQQVLKSIDINAQLESPTKVIAAPNPFNDKVRFSLKSAVSGQGSLELYNLMGQRVKTVYQGLVEANRIMNIEYAVPSAQRTNLIYIFRVGDQKATGKLIGLKQ